VKISTAGQLAMGSTKKLSQRYDNRAPNADEVGTLLLGLIAFPVTAMIYQHMCSAQTLGCGASGSAHVKVASQRLIQVPHVPTPMTHYNEL